MELEILKKEVRTGISKKYEDKQLHIIPPAPVFDRVQYILDKCRDRIVVNMGCKGKLHPAIIEVARKVYGVDKDNGEIEHLPNLILMDLDNLHHSSFYLPPDREIVICGEILEHLANPGMFLEKLQIASCPIVFTVPNSYSRVGYDWMEKEIENINREHVSYYSYYTFKTLVEKYGYTIQEWGWYNGKPRFAEGLIFNVSYKGT